MSCLVNATTLTDSTSVSASMDVIFESDGAKLDAGKTSGYIISKPINLSSNDIVFNLSSANTKPSGTGVIYLIF